jgi:hypothetical protein
MPPHKKKVKAQKGKPEIIMVLRSFSAMKGFQDLQLRRRKMRDPDLAQMAIPVKKDLERVTVNKLDNGVACNNDVALIHIRNDMAVRMNNLKSSSQIPRSINEKSPISSGKELLAVRRPVKLMDSGKTGNPGHDKAANRASPAKIQAGNRPGSNLLERLIALLRHANELSLLAGLDRAMINLRNNILKMRNLKDCTLAANTQPAAKAARLTISKEQIPMNRHTAG